MSEQLAPVNATPSNIEQDQELDGFGKKTF